MSLRKSPTRTPALLAANRANARKSTGPRTARGKSFVRLNALRHGRRSRPLGRILSRGGDLGVNRKLYEWLADAVRKISRPRTPSYEANLLRTEIQVLFPEIPMYKACNLNELLVTRHDI